MHYPVSVRVLGIDLGERRIGLAISDASATLARPLRVLERTASDEAAVDALLAEIDRLSHDDPLGSIVIGLPMTLDGRPTEQTPRVRVIAGALARRVTIPIVFQDERLSSHEADQRLATQERDWRKRKAKLDAAAAAVILQDYLDGVKG
jgi:putative Holliday junction resolvase